MLRALKLFKDEEHEQYEGFVLFDNDGKLIAVQDVDIDLQRDWTESEIRSMFHVEEKLADSPDEMAIQHGFFVSGRDNWLGGGSNPLTYSPNRVDEYDMKRGGKK